MKTGRNEPCPCGSGQKYKKCCLIQQEREAEAERSGEKERLAATKSWTHDDRYDDYMAMPDATPETEDAVSRFWEAFEEAHHQERIQLFLNALGEADLLDDDLAYDCLTELHTANRKHNELEPIEPILDAFQKRLPEIYAVSEHYYLAWRIENAINAGQHSEICRLAELLGDKADREFDLFTDVQEQLAYHGYLPALLAACRSAYPKVEKSADIFNWAKQNFVETAKKYVVFDYLERTDTPNATDRDLQQALEHFGPVNQAELQLLLGHLMDQHNTNWSLGDFEPNAIEFDIEQNGDDEGTSVTTRAERLHFLSLEFINHTYRHLGISHTKADLGITALCTYLLARSLGKAKPETATTKNKHRKKANRKSPSHPLCPYPASLQRHIESVEGFFIKRGYPLTAALELIPAWLDYLQSRGLLVGLEPASVMRALRPLYHQRIERMETLQDDAALLHNLKVVHAQIA